VAYLVLIPVLLSLGANFYTPAEKEAALGAQLAAQTERENTSLGLTAVDQYVDALGHRLAAQMSRDPLTWTFRVIRDNRGGSTCEPISLPGGYVFVPARLILAAANEAEFAGMLAHSMAHVAQRHGLQTANLAIPVIFVGAAGFGDESAVAPVGYLKYHRQYELEADQVGTRAIAAAGYDAGALLSFVRRRQQDAGRPEFSLLPERSVRIANLEQTIRDLPAPQTNVPVGRFDLVQAECRRRIAPVPTLFR